MDYSGIAVVTGANGFVGSHLVDFLLEKNFKVRCIVRKTSNLQWLEGKDLEIHDCGLTDKNGLREAFKDADYIFHVAGVVKSKTKAGYFEGNVDTTRVLLEVAAENPGTIKRFLLVSSLTATGPSCDTNPVTEIMECKPITTYGRSKRKQEELVLSYMDKFPVTVCRAPAVYGERDTEIFIYFATFAKGLTTTIGFNNKALSLVHVRDLVEGFYQAATSERSKGEIYFVGSEEHYTWEQINKITSKVLGKKAVQVKVPHFLVYSIAAVAQFFAKFSSKPATLNIEKAKDITQQYWTCSTAKASDHFGYKQKISIEEGIKRTVKWYKEKGWIK